MWTGSPGDSTPGIVGLWGKGLQEDTAYLLPVTPRALAETRRVEGTQYLGPHKVLHAFLKSGKSNGRHLQLVTVHISFLSPAGYS